MRARSLVSQGGCGIMVGRSPKGLEMSILSASGLSKFYGAQEVFSGLEILVARGDKIALVGPNGAGKTTLLRILVGLEEPSAGVIRRARGLKVGYLPQKPSFSSDETLYGEMLKVFADLRAQQVALEALATEMALHPDLDEAMRRYAEASERFERAGGYAYENRIQRVLSGLGFEPEACDWPISVLSGGQITRALLAQLLLQEPELLVLDEPTNYLDLAALEWLEGYLQSWPHSLIVVSHDRYFLDKIATRVWELNHGRLEAYRGNYSHYVEQREARHLRQERAFEAQQAYIAKTEEFIRRYKAGQRSREAKGREKRLNRLAHLEAPRHDRTMVMRLEANLRSGDQVLIAREGVTIGFDAPPGQAGGDGGAPYILFRAGPILVERGERVALLGPNGSGKTTFIRTILGELQPLAGRIRLGASVRVGYLPQTSGWLDPAKTALEQVMEWSGLLAEEARNVLGRFLFSGDDVFKRTAALSGGELARLALCLLTLRGANLLILDEPTTHLDIASQEVLQQVLAEFEGTILFVSHDRYLIDALATHIWEIERGELRQFEGNYTAYQAAKQASAAERAPTKEEGASEWAARQRALRQRQLALRRREERLQALEQEIAQLEGDLKRIVSRLHSASVAQDAARIAALGREYEAIEQALAERLEEWERLANQAEEQGE